MSLVTILYIAFTVIVWLWSNGEKLTKVSKVVIGILYGISCILSTHFGVDYGHMVLNVRDLGPLIAGLYFDPLSGVIAGLIGGIERYIAGTYFRVGAYTTIACSLSTCLAGMLAMLLSINIFNRKSPNPVYAFFMGAVMEVFHMYAVLITHSDNLTMAFYVVSACSAPMILFSAIGLFIISLIITYLSNDRVFSEFRNRRNTISNKFQLGLLLVILIVMFLNLIGAFVIQTGTAYQSAEYALQHDLNEISQRYNSKERLPNSTDLGQSGSYIIFNENGSIIKGARYGDTILKSERDFINSQVGKWRFNFYIFNEEFICRAAKMNDGSTLLLLLSLEEVFWYRNVQAYESIFGAILLLAIVYIIVSMMVNKIVVNNINDINNSLNKITNGDLNEVVNVKSTTEFLDLSYGINETVTALKGYIEDAKKRIEQELELAATIQSSSLPKIFEFPNHEEIEIFAIMDAAKEIGGDFYDFFMVGPNRLALVIADVSGKGIPAALFMMKAKTAIRSFAQTSISPKEILKNANNSLCEGNDAEMFVTVWIGIIKLETGEMICANAGHEYPVIYRNGKGYELLKDKHTLPLAVIENMSVEEYNLKLEPGDKIFVYTDGVPEAIDKNETQYSTDRLVNTLNEYKNLSPAALLPIIRKDVEKFTEGAEQFDDITMLEFRIDHYNNRK